MIIEDQQQHIVDMSREIVTSHFGHVVSDLLILFESRELEELLDIDNERNRSVLAEMFLSYYEMKRVYDQIRLLDETGMEVVRVNFDNGQPYVVPEDELKDKRDRYYFQEIMQLGPGEILITKLDFLSTILN